MNEDFACAFCLAACNYENPPWRLQSCSHFYHRSCIEEWQQVCIQKNTLLKCPLCNQIFQANSWSQEPIVSLRCKLQCSNGKTVNLLFWPKEKIDQFIEKIGEISGNNCQQLTCLIYNRPYTYGNGNMRLIDLSLIANQLIIVDFTKRIIQILIQQSNQSFFGLHIGIRWSVQDLCNLLEELTGINKEYQIFRLRGKIFNFQTPCLVSDFEIYNSTQINLDVIIKHDPNKKIGDN